MKLRLKNFKQYKDFTIELPDTGMVLLKGSSGAGKSTILHGIHHAKYGEAKKIYPWGGGSPSVELETNIPEYIKIVRTNTPNTLTVVTNLGEFKDDAAQAEIVRVFGMNYTESLAAEYIRQKLKGSLLSLSEADQLRFIQKLAFGDQDPEITKKKINNLLTKATAESNAMLTSIKSSEDRIGTNEKKISDSALALIKPVSIIPDNEIPIIRHAAESNWKSYLADMEAIKQLDAKMSNPLYKKLASYDEFKKIKELELANIINEKAKLEAATKEKWVSFLGEDSPILIECRKTLTAATAKNAYLKTLNSAQALSAEAKLAFPELTGRLGEWMEKAISVENTLIDSYRQKVAALNAEIAVIVASPDMQACPHCTGALTVKSGAIHKHDGTSEKSKIPQLLEDKKNTELCVSTSIAKVEKMRHYLNQAVFLKSQLKEDPMPGVNTTEEVSAKSAEATSIIERNEEISHALSAMHQQKVYLCEKEDVVRSELTKALAETEQARTLPPLEMLAAKKAEIQSGMSLKEKLSADFSAKINIISAYEKEMSVYNSSLAQIQGWRDMNENDVNDLKEKQGKSAALLLKIGALTRLKELSNFAAIRAVDGIINDINANAQAYLGKLFPDTGTSVKILNTSKTDKGEERAKLSCEITHKGEDAGKNTENLSGGEEDRIVLAFQLAIADIYSTNLLMVDEGFSSTDTEVTMQLGLELLKDIADKKLVLVIQHGAPEGVFDEIRDIG